MIIIDARSHVDHGLTDEHLSFIRIKFGYRDAFFIETVNLDDVALPYLSSALYGPLAGDVPVPEAEVYYATRGTRTNKSRLINKPTRLTNVMTVIAGPDANGQMILFTAYGGRPAPREPNMGMTDAENAESCVFWSQHALAEETP